MKLFLLSLSLLLSIRVFAGGEVPWPIDKQEPLILRQLDGLWLSSTITSPRLMYYIKTEKVKSKKCPYKVHVWEINSTSGDMLFAGAESFCKTLQERAAIILYDKDHVPQRYLEIVGVKNGKNFQNIGLSIFGYDGAIVSKDRVDQDIFFKAIVTKK